MRVVCSIGLLVATSLVLTEKWWGSMVSIKARFENQRCTKDEVFWKSEWSRSFFVKCLCNVHSTWWKGVLLCVAGCFLKSLCKCQEVVFEHKWILRESGMLLIMLLCYIGKAWQNDKLMNKARQGSHMTGKWWSNIVLSKATLFFLSLDRKFPAVGVVAAFFDNARQIVRSGLRECMQLVVLARLGFVLLCLDSFLDRKCKARWEVFFENEWRVFGLWSCAASCVWQKNSHSAKARWIKT